MKKMKLQMLGLSVNDLLSREEMKKVMGGSGGGSGSSCLASADCVNCSGVSCSGKSTCSGTDNVGVTCDGTTTSCLHYDSYVKACI